MSEFPREALEDMANGLWTLAEERNVFRQAIKAYDQLADRCVMDRAEMSAEIGRLRAELTALYGVNGKSQ